jgi:hypothetical protein
MRTLGSMHLDAAPVTSVTAAVSTAHLLDMSNFKRAAA